MNPFLIAIATILQLAATLLGVVQNDPNMPAAQRDAIVAFAATELSKANDALATYALNQPVAITVPGPVTESVATSSDEGIGGPGLAKPPKVQIDKANPSKEAKDYYYSALPVRANDCSSVKFTLPQFNLPAYCAMTSDGSAAYPRGTSNPFVGADTASGQVYLPLAWLKDQPTVPTTADEFLKLYDKYSCQVLVSKVDAGTLILSTNPGKYGECKALLGL